MSCILAFNASNGRTNYDLALAYAYKVGASALAVTKLCVDADDLTTVGS